MGCHAVLQGIFRTQGSNPRFTCLALADGFFTTSAIWKPMTSMGHLPVLVAGDEQSRKRVSHLLIG